MELIFLWSSKLLPLLVYPVSLCIGLLIFAFISLLFGRLIWATIFLVLALSILWVSSTPYIAQKLYHSLESRYPSLSLEVIPPQDCVVLLGGMMSQELPPRQAADFNESVDRLFLAWELYRAGKAPTIIIAAGHLPWEKVVSPEADVLKALLVTMGVPADAIIIDPLSRNTRENALHVQQLMTRIQCENVLLVTSAAHMPRAVGLFRQLGISVTPVPTDFRAVDYPPTVFLFLPSVEALSLTTGAMREYIGLWVYALRGWL